MSFPIRLWLKLAESRVRGALNIAVFTENGANNPNDPRCI